MRLKNVDAITQPVKKYFSDAIANSDGKTQTMLLDGFTQMRKLCGDRQITMRNLHENLAAVDFGGVLLTTINKTRSAVDNVNKICGAISGRKQYEKLHNLTLTAPKLDLTSQN